MSSEDLNDIPEDKRDDFPAGVSEEEYATEAEMTAFLNGLGYADDVDVTHGDVFMRENGKFVVRICVGEWGDDD
jgi:hypothetical protein